MTQPPSPAPAISRRFIPVVIAIVVAALVGVGATLSVVQAYRAWQPPTISSSVTIVRPTPDVLVAVRDLARLETTTYHIERVIDLRDKQSRLFGLVESEDAILLVAAADVSAGVDLRKLGPADVRADPTTGRARLELPAAEIFQARLDNQRTFVHSRSTDMLARRVKELETRARQEAERTAREAALEADILDKAESNAEQTIATLVRSLGFRDVEVRCKLR